MSIVVCAQCSHPFTEHEDSGCADLIYPCDDLGVAGYPEACPCEKTAGDVLRQVVPPSERIALLRLYLERRCSSAPAEVAEVFEHIDRLAARCEQAERERDTFRRWNEDGARLNAVVMRGNSDYSQHLRRAEAEAEGAIDERDDARARADGYALLVGEYRAALSWYSDERNYDAGPVASINRYDRWPVVQDAGERARAILAAEPEARAASLLEAARGMERAIQTWLDDPSVDATQEETDLLGEAYGVWMNVIAGTSGPARIEPTP